MGTTQSSASETPGRSGKPREAQGLLNRLAYHPAARRLATLLSRTPVTPNMVSVFGAAMVIAAGILYALVGGTAAIAAGFALHLAWHVVDGADGDLARMSGRASPSGEVVDGLCDYGGHVVLYLLLGWAMSATIGGWAWVLVVAAGASRIVQSVYAESQRRTYLWWAYGIPWLKGSGGAGEARVGRRLAASYLRVSSLLTAGTEPVDRLVAALPPGSIERRRIASAAREAGRRTLPPQIALGANSRTVLLGLSMIAGHPMWFFLIEITLLNGLLAASLAQQRASSRGLLRQVTGPVA